jgi:CubicO group peptidase (beta-lactamase class C family)
MGQLAKIILALCSCLAPLLAQDYLDSVVERARKEFNVPGIAVAVVKDGSVVVSKGFGVRRLGSPEPVTAHTIFAIGSNTKLFTSIALAILVDEGKLDWNDRVVDRLPGFQMSDGYVSREMRIRDLLCHRSGLSLGAGDLMFWPGTDFKPEDINYRLRFIPLATSFRSAYAYDNVLYDSAGLVIQQVSSKPWGVFVRERIFTPLEMRDSKTSIREVSSSTDAVAPHAIVEGKLTALEHRPLDNVAPAGAIVSSVDDMSRWVITLLNQGALPAGGSKRLYSEAQAKTVWTPLTILPVGKPPAELSEMQAHFASYAMGEVITEYRGSLEAWHTGGVQGMVSYVAMLPMAKLGVIVLTNQESQGSMIAIGNAIFDHYLNSPPKDWVAAWAAVENLQRQKGEKAVAEASGKRNSTSKPSLAIAAYGGRYRDPWYGDVIIDSQDDRLSMRFTHTPDLTGSLKHWQGDTFVVRWKDRSLGADAFVTFWLNPDGTVNQVKMKPVSPLTDFSFDFQDLVLKPVAKDAPPY